MIVEKERPGYDALAKLVDPVFPIHLRLETNVCCSTRRLCCMDVHENYRISVMLRMLNSVIIKTEDVGQSGDFLRVKKTGDLLYRRSRFH